MFVKNVKELSDVATVTETEERDYAQSSKELESEFENSE